MIRQLKKNEIIDIYTTHAVRHFPDNERKPVSSITRMTDEGIYIGYGLYNEDDEQELICYAFFVMLPDKRNILLDYFAVMESCRSNGIGSLFLTHMKTSVTAYDGILLEIEDPNFASDESESAERNSRLAFYSRNGAIFTGILAEVFGVHYQVLFLPILAVPNIETLFTDFDTIYQHMVSKRNYETAFSIKRSE